MSPRALKQAGRERGRRAEHALSLRSFALWVPFLLGLAAYLPTLGHDFVWDDVPFIVANPAARPERLGEALGHGYGWVPAAGDRADESIYFRPVIVVANALQWAIAGGRPWLFHFANALTHGATATLVTTLGLLLGLGSAAALLAGGLFALHPLNSEAVAWISGRTDVSAAFFGLLALVLLAWRQRAGGGAGRAWAAGAALFLALASKESAAIFVPLAAVILWLEWPAQTRSGQAASDRRAPGSAAASRGPAWAALGLAAGLYVILRLAVLKGPGVATSEMLGTFARPAGFGDRLLLGGNLTLLYLGRLLLPVQLNIEPPVDLARPPLAPLGGIAGTALFAALSVLWLVWIVRALQGRPRAGRLGSPAFLTGLGLLLGGLAPVLQWWPIGELYGERFAYLSSAGFLLGCAVLIEPWLSRGWTRAWLLGGILAAGCLVLLQTRLPDWKSEAALFGRAIERSPDSPRVLAAHAEILLRERRLTEAEPLLARAAALAPANAETQARYGSLLVDLGRPQEGVPRLEAAYKQMKPTKTLLLNLGIGYTRMGRYDEAVPLLRRARDLAPGDPAAIEALATGERGRGNFDDADRLYREALALGPGRKSLYLNLFGLHYFDRRDMQEARAWGMRLLEKFPSASEAAQVRTLLEQAGEGG